MLQQNIHETKSGYTARSKSIQWGIVTCKHANVASGYLQPQHGRYTIFWIALGYLRPQHGRYTSFWIAFQNSGDLNLLGDYSVWVFVFSMNLLSFWLELCDVGTQTWNQPKQHAEDLHNINDRYAKEVGLKINCLWIQNIFVRRVVCFFLPYKQT